MDREGTAKSTNHVVAVNKMPSKNDDYINSNNSNKQPDNSREAIHVQSKYVQQQLEISNGGDTVVGGSFTSEHGAPSSRLNDSGGRSALPPRNEEKIAQPNSKRQGDPEPPRDNKKFKQTTLQIFWKNTSTHNNRGEEPSSRREEVAPPPPPPPSSHHQQQQQQLAVEPPSGAIGVSNTFEAIIAIHGKLQAGSNVIFDITEKLLSQLDGSNPGNMSSHMSLITLTATIRKDMFSAMPSSSTSAKVPAPIPPSCIDLIVSSHQGMYVCVPTPITKRANVNSWNFDRTTMWYILRAFVPVRGDKLVLKRFAAKSADNRERLLLCLKRDQQFILLDYDALRALDHSLSGVDSNALSLNLLGRNSFLSLMRDTFLSGTNIKTTLKLITESTIDYSLNVSMGSNRMNSLAQPHTYSAVSSLLVHIHKTQEKGIYCRVSEYIDEKSKKQHLNLDFRVLFNALEPKVGDRLCFAQSGYSGTGVLKCIAWLERLNGNTWEVKEVSEDIAKRLNVLVGLGEEGGEEAAGELELDYIDENGDERAVTDKARDYIRSSKAHFPPQSQFSESDIQHAKENRVKLANLSLDVLNRAVRSCFSDAKYHGAHSLYCYRGNASGAGVDMPKVEAMYVGVSGDHGVRATSHKTSAEKAAESAVGATHWARLAARFEEALQMVVLQDHISLELSMALEVTGIAIFGTHHVSGGHGGGNTLRGNQNIGGHSIVDIIKMCFVLFADLGFYVEFAIGRVFGLPKDAAEVLQKVIDIPAKQQQQPQQQQVDYLIQPISCSQLTGAIPPHSQQSPSQQQQQQQVVSSTRPAISCSQLTGAIPPHSQQPPSQQQQQQQVESPIRPTVSSSQLNVTIPPQQQQSKQAQSQQPQQHQPSQDLDVLWDAVNNSQVTGAIPPLPQQPQSQQQQQPQPQPQPQPQQQVAKQNHLQQQHPGDVDHMHFNRLFYSVSPPSPPSSPPGIVGTAMEVCDNPDSSTDFGAADKQLAAPTSCDKVNWSFYDCLDADDDVGSKEGYCDEEEAEPSLSHSSQEPVNKDSDATSLVPAGRGFNPPANVKIEEKNAIVECIVTFRNILRQNADLKRSQEVLRRRISNLRQL